MRNFLNVVKDTFLIDFPIFKRVATSKKNGDVFEVSKELQADEKVDHFRVSSSPDSFADAVERVADVSMIDRFDAIAQLNAAIANIEYVKPSDDEK